MNHIMYLASFVLQCKIKRILNILTMRTDYGDEF